MNSEPAAASPDLASRSTAHAVHAIVQFARVVRYRQTVVVAALAVGVLIGGLYYATATRYFQAKASLLVLQSGVDVTNTSMTSEGMKQGLMPTYERLFSSAVVLEGALKYLHAADRADFQQAPREKWLAILRDNLTASTVRQTNIIEIAYRSREPKASVAVVNAVMRAYLEFMDKTHKGTAGEIINLLTKEKGQLEERLARKEEEVLLARRRFGDLGIRADSHVVHPLVQRAIGLNDALIKSQQKRLELQAALAAVQTAVRNGEDLQQHLLSLESSVGKEFLLSGLGLNSEEVWIKASLEKNLLADQSELRSLQGYYGPMHPRVQEVASRIQLSQQYLSGYQAKAGEKQAQMRDKQLGPLLLKMLQQQLSETAQHEASLRTNFEQARVEAVNLNGDMARLEMLEHDLRGLRDWRDELLNKIAGTDLKQDHQDIRTAVVSEPALPKTPVWPRLTVIAILSLGGGLGVGLGLVYVLDILDDRFRSPEELQAQLGVPVLAMVRQMDDLQTTGLAAIQAHVAPDATESEAFRTLRTTLAFTNGGASRIVISSAEPGDGKTTVMANLAVSYVQAGKRTLLIDADMRRPGLTTLLGLKGQPGLADVLTETGNVADAALSHLHRLDADGLDFLPAGPRRVNPGELLAGNRLAELLAWAETVYDQILIDSPPALAASDASIIGRLVDGLVLVVQPKKNQRRLVLRAAESLATVGVNLLGIVVNRISSQQGDTLYGYGSGYGYGYGYSHDYAEGDDAHDDVRDKDEPATLEMAASQVGGASTREDKETGAGNAGPPGIIPRRVA